MSWFKNACLATLKYLGVEKSFISTETVPALPFKVVTKCDWDREHGVPMIRMSQDNDDQERCDD